MPEIAPEQGWDKQQTVLWMTNVVSLLRLRAINNDEMTGHVHFHVFMTMNMGDNKVWNEGTVRSLGN